MNSAISMILTCAATIISGMILFLLQRFLTRQQKKEEQNERAKATESTLILRSLNALGKLTVANSIALRDGKTNGEMGAALREYEKVEEEMYQYLITSRSGTR